MENTEGRRGNTRCIVRSPEFEVSVGHPGGHSSPGEPRYQSKKLSWTQLLQSLVERNQRVKGCWAGHNYFGVTGREKPKGERGCTENCNRSD